MIPLRDTVPSRHWPIMTWLLILANVAVFYYQSRLTTPEYKVFLHQYSLDPVILGRRIATGDYLIFPLVTYMFLHGDLMHIISNLWALWLFGDNVEDKMGAFRFLLFYTMAGIISGLTHFYFNQHSPTPTLGASGAIAGVMGAYCIMYPRAKIVTLIPIFILPWFVNIPAMIYLVFWFLSQVYSALGSGGVAPSVAWWAHVGGFTFGFLLHRLFFKPGRE